MQCFWGLPEADVFCGEEWAIGVVMERGITVELLWEEAVPLLFVGLGGEDVFVTAEMVGKPTPVQVVIEAVAIPHVLFIIDG